MARQIQRDLEPGELGAVATADGSVFLLIGKPDGGQLNCGMKPEGARELGELLCTLAREAEQRAGIACKIAEAEAQAPGLTPEQMPYESAPADKPAAEPTPAAPAQPSQLLEIIRAHGLARWVTFEQLLAPTIGIVDESVRDPRVAATAHRVLAGFVHYLAHNIQELGEDATGLAGAVRHHSAADLVAVLHMARARGLTIGLPRGIAHLHLL